MKNQPDITQAIITNLGEKFAYLSRQCAEMSLHWHKNIQYVDSARASDTFNTVLGMPADSQDIAQITDYYRKAYKPAAWWFPQSSRPLTAILSRAGWQFEEQNVGMYLIFPATSISSTFPTIESGNLQILLAKDTQQILDFGSVLSSLFAASNEADNVFAIYQRLARQPIPHDSPLTLLIGYEDGVPVATAAVFMTGSHAGIFDVATHSEKRNRGYGSAIFDQALQLAQQKGATLGLLQASADGLAIYRRAGFVEAGNFDVWNLTIDTAR